jgi:serine/threonine-protein kinase RsbW
MHIADNGWTWTIDRVFPSATGAGTQILTEMLDQLRHEGWEEQQLFGIHLAVEEALVNAIRHGNESDHKKCVHVCCKLSPSHFWVRIKDEGCGFVPDDVPDCTEPDRLETPSGRGIMLMRNFMTRVEYNDAGNCVEMEKTRDVAAEDTTAEDTNEG